MPDPLASTLVVLPVVLLGLWAVDTWQRSHGDYGESPANAVFQLGALVVLVLVILGRQNLGLEADGPGMNQVLAGALVLLLALRVSDLVRSLMRAFSPDTDTRPPWPFFLLPLVVFVAILPWSATQREPDGDEPYFLLIAHSLAYDLDTDLNNNYVEQHSLSFMSRALEPSWADPEPRQGRVYSRHGPLFPLILAPGYRVAGKWGAMLTMALLGAVAAWLSLYLGLRYWGVKHSKQAVGVWVLLSLTPPLLVYSHQIWIELPAAIVLLMGLLTIRNLQQQRGDPRKQWMILAALLLVLPLLKLRFAVLSVSLLGLAWWRCGRSKRAIVWLGLGLSAVIGGILVYNQVVFGSPFKDHTLAQLLQIQGGAPIDYLRGSAGLFWDCAFGLLASNPLWVLLLPAAALGVWGRSPVLADVAICALPYLALVSPRAEWYGAWAPPFRFGMVLLPVLAIILIPLLRRQTAGARGLMAALGMLALVFALLWAIVPGWTYNLAAGTNYLIDHLSSRMSTDVGRFFPSMVRPRAATLWVPLLAAPVVIFLWWYPRFRPKQAESWATALLLLLVSAVPVAGARVPTGWVEFEDRQVEKKGGVPYPDPWAYYRPRFRGGWELGPGDSVRAPIVRGGDQLSVRIDARLIGGSPDSMILEVFAGSYSLGAWSPGTQRNWQTFSLEDKIWPAGADLVVVVRANKSTDDGSRVILDRARLAWR